MRIFNIGLVGCGTVGRGVAELIARRAGLIERRYGVGLLLRRIVNRSAISLPKSARLSVDVKVSRDYRDVLRDPEIDCVVELIGGTTTARRVILGGLKAGKHVITANKALVAEHGPELFRAAKKASRHIFFEASVAGGIPIIKVLTEGLAANRFHAITAILNGTSNYILTQMTRSNQPFQKALRSAQENGYAEKNPFLDVSGNDTRHKLAILTTLAFNQHITPREILCEGISGVNEMDIRVAREMGYTIKPIAVARQVEGELDVRVHPALLSDGHLLANVHGVYNAVVLNGDRVGETVYTGEGAGQLPTASSVVADLIDCGLASARPLLARRAYLTQRHMNIRKPNRIMSEYYFRFDVKDQPGVLARISGILGQYRISVARVIQKGHGRGSVPLVMLTHLASEHHVRHAIHRINRLSVIKGASVVLRVETE